MELGNKLEGRIQIRNLGFQSKMPLYLHHTIFLKFNAKLELNSVLSSLKSMRVFAPRHLDYRL